MASIYYIDVTAGQTVHLRSSAATQSSNVITELPRGYPVEFVSSLDPFFFRGSIHPRVGDIVEIHVVSSLCGNLESGASWLCYSHLHDARIDNGLAGLKVNTHRGSLCTFFR